MSDSKYKFFDLICEDYTGLGGPMGSETTFEIFRVAFATVEKAKAFAEQDHKKRDDRDPIRWRGYFSGDLSGHAYTIKPRTIHR